MSQVNQTVLSQANGDNIVQLKQIFDPVMRSLQNSNMKYQIYSDIDPFIQHKIQSQSNLVKALMNL